MPTMISDKMKHAIKLIKAGKTPAQAATIAGVKRQSIYASRAYSTMRMDQRAKEGK